MPSLLRRPYTTNQFPWFIAIRRRVKRTPAARARKNESARAPAEIGVRCDISIRRDPRAPVTRFCLERERFSPLIVLLLVKILRLYELRALVLGSQNVKREITL